jgi:hypothetical protein
MSSPRWNSPPCFTDLEAKRVLRKLCEECRVSIELLQDLCELEHEHTAKQRVEAIDDQIAQVIDRHRGQLPD